MCRPDWSIVTRLFSVTVTWIFLLSDQSLPFIFIRCEQFTSQGIYSQHYIWCSSKHSLLFSWFMLTLCKAKMLSHLFPPGSTHYCYNTLSRSFIFMGESLLLGTWHCVTRLRSKQQKQVQAKNKCLGCELLSINMWICYIRWLIYWHLHFIFNSCWIICMFADASQMLHVHLTCQHLNKSLRVVQV